MQTVDRHTLLTKTPIPKLIWKLATPTMVSMMVTGIYSSADTYFVGKVSTEATAAVGLVFSVMAIIQACGFFFGHGSGNYISRLLGAKDTKKANEIAVTGFALSILFGVVISVLGNIFAVPIAYFIGASEATVSDTLAYMRVILLAAPVTMSQFVINNQLRYQGSAIYAMVGLLFGAVVNIGLDPLLILGFHLGAQGAAIATVSGQIMSFIVLLIGTGKGENIRLHPQNIRISIENILQIINGGAPSLARQAMAAISTLLLNRMAGIYGGDPAIAGMSVATRVLMLLFSALIGFGQGYQPVCSYNYGAKLYSRVREGFYYCVKWGTVMTTTLGVVCFIFADPLISWFRDDPDVVAVGAVALRFQTAVLPLLALSIITNMMLQSMGKGVIASITSSARNGIFFIPLIIILPLFFGLTGVEITQAGADVLTFIFCLFVVRKELKKMPNEDVDIQTV